VQGVGFRWFVREQARALGLAGSVRNADDGAVDVHASGTRDELAQLETLLRSGPAGARVREVRRVDHDETALDDVRTRALTYPFAIDR
jgi:acylphosphatase